jgi:hypothetical protein
MENIIMITNLCDKMRKLKSENIQINEIYARNIKTCIDEIEAYANKEKQNKEKQNNNPIDTYDEYINRLCFAINFVFVHRNLGMPPIIFKKKRELEFGYGIPNDHDIGESGQLIRLYQEVVLLEKLNSLSPEQISKITKFISLELLHFIISYLKCKNLEMLIENESRIINKSAMSSTIWAQNYNSIDRVRNWWNEPLKEQW